MTDTMLGIPVIEVPTLADTNRDPGPEVPEAVKVFVTATLTETSAGTTAPRVATMGATAPFPPAVRVSPPVVTMVVAVVTEIGLPFEAAETMSKRCKWRRAW